MLPRIERMLAPRPLIAGSVIGITSPSSGVVDALYPRLEVAIDALRARGFQIRVGTCMDGSGVTSASAVARAAEFMDLLLDPQVRAVVPPWGGELAVEVLPHLDFEALADAEPTWVVGYSDMSTLLMPLTLRLGWLTLHGQNLMDTPYRVPEPLVSWLDVVTAAQPATIVQGASTRHRRAGHDDWEQNPGASEYRFDGVGGWRPLDTATTSVVATGALIGGCVETVSTLAGTPYGDVAAFGRAQGSAGLIVYLEAAEQPALDIARGLWRLRLAGWFDHSTAILVGRTTAPDSPGFTQDDAVRSALGDLGVPILLDVDCGHVPPHLALLNGAQTSLSWTPTGSTISQRVPTA